MTTEVSDLLRIADKLSDAAQAMLDHEAEDEHYDKTLHRIELRDAVRDYLMLRGAAVTTVEPLRDMDQLAIPDLTQEEADSFVRGLRDG